MQLGGTLIRIACNQAARGSFVNALGGQPPVIPRAGSVRLPCAIFFDDPSVAANLVTDLGNLATANCVIRAGGPAGTVIFEQTIAAASFHAALTYQQWTAGAGAHFEFVLSPTDSNVAAGPIYIAIGVTTSDAGDIPLAYSTTARVRDYGIFNAGAPTAPDYTSWSKAESDARYVLDGSGALAPMVTGVGTGAAGALETLPTAGLAIPTMRTFRDSGYLRDWILDAGTDANAADADGRPTLQRPTDFDVTNNPRVWTRWR